VPPVDPKSTSSAGGPAPKKKRTPPKATNQGRRHDIPWHEIEVLYVQGEVTKGNDGKTEHSWPTAEQLATRFKVNRTTIHNQSRARGWVLRREEFQRKVAEELEAARAKHFIEKASDLWGPQAKAAWELNVRVLEEAKFALDFHKSGQAAQVAALARASATRGRKPSGGDDDSQRPSGGAAAAPPDAAQREPVPARDLKDISSSIKTSTENLRALLVGTTPPGTTPTAPPGGPAPVPLGGDPRVAAVMESFVLQAMRQNADPNKGGGKK